MKCFPGTATLPIVIECVEHLSFGKVFNITLHFLGSLAFRYEKASLTHRALQANNCTPARCISVDLISWCRQNTLQCALCFNRSKANFSWQPNLLLPKQPHGYIYSRDMPITINRRNGGCWGSTVTWKILKSWFHLFRQFINLFLSAFSSRYCKTQSMRFCYFVLNLKI